MAQVVGQVSSYAFSSGQENTAVRYVDKDVTYLYPEESALMTLMMSVKGMKETVDATKLECLEKDYAVRWTTMGTTTATAGTATLGVTDGTAFTPGHLVQVPNSSGTGMEVFRVTAVSGNNLTATRGFAGTTAAQIDAGGALSIIGTAFEEGGAPATAQKTNAATIVSYMQIAKNAIEMSNTAKRVRVYGTNNVFKQNEMEAMVAHKVGMSRALYFGPPAYEGLTAGENGRPLRATQSLVSRLSTNVFNVGGTLTFNNFLDWSASVFEYGTNKTRLLVASPVFHKAIAAWSFNRLQVTEGTSKVGVKIATVVTPFGNFKMVNDYQLKDGIANKYGWGGNAFILDPESVKFCVLKGRDTHMVPDAKQDGYDRQFSEIRTEYAWKIDHEERHGRIFNVTGYQS